MKGSKIIIAILIASICLQVGTLISVKSSKAEKTDTKTEASLFGYDSGKFIGVAYNESEFVLYSIKENDNTNSNIVKNTKKFTDDKIVSVKVMNSPLATDETEAGIIVTESGKTYVAYEDSGDGFYYNEFYQLNDYKVKEVVSIEDSSESITIKVILQDGTSKTITNK